MKSKYKTNNLNKNKELNPGKSINDLTIDELKIANLTEKQVLEVNGDIISIQAFSIIIDRFGKILAKETRKNPINKKPLWAF